MEARILANLGSNRGALWSRKCKCVRKVLSQYRISGITRERFSFACTNAEPPSRRDRERFVSFVSASRRRGVEKGFNVGHYVLHGSENGSSLPEFDDHASGGCGESAHLANLCFGGALTLVYLRLRVDDRRVQRRSGHRLRPSTVEVNIAARIAQRRASAFRVTRVDSDDRIVLASFSRNTHSEPLP